MKAINLPDKFAFTVEQVSELLAIDPQVIRANIKKDPIKDPRKYLRAIKPSEREFRILHEDLQDFIDRNYYGIAK